jgi:hypothetical protein
MPQTLNLACGGTLLVWCQTRTLLPGCPGGVVLEFEQILHLPGQRSHPDVEVRAIEVRHNLKAPLPYRVLMIQNQEKHDRQCYSGGKAVLTQGVRVICAIISTLVSSSLLMMDPDHCSIGLKGIVMLTSHQSNSWTLDSQQR